MSIIYCVKQSLSWGSLLLGFLSAYYWYRSGVAKITDNQNVYNPSIELAYDDPSCTGQKIYVVATAMEQSRLNKIAAIYTALAVTAQSIATFLP